MLVPWRVTTSMVSCVNLTNPTGIPCPAKRNSDIGLKHVEENGGGNVTFFIGTQNMERYKNWEVYVCLYMIDLTFLEIPIISQSVIMITKLSIITSGTPSYVSYMATSGRRSGGGRYISEGVVNPVATSRDLKRVWYFAKEDCFPGNNHINQISLSSTPLKMKALNTMSWRFRWFSFSIGWFFGFSPGNIFRDSTPPVQEAGGSGFLLGGLSQCSG